MPPAKFRPDRHPTLTEFLRRYHQPAPIGTPVFGPKQDDRVHSLGVFKIMDR
ncbi:uncharacterized protein An01g06600 [Aspergillus niger]|uniref:Contig An01c0240, genomic contig n=2 Tax=Aspergillus niger TaxID=5061 RepID=A2Q945_ASPNC|nr:uncharacterized protein An01g06600 [Aspergillus niger]CAK43779.1 unnamed protein product [Aspergillus niger]